MHVETDDKIESSAETSCWTPKDGTSDVTVEEVDFADVFEMDWQITAMIFQCYLQPWLSLLIFVNYKNQLSFSFQFNNFTLFQHSYNDIAHVLQRIPSLELERRGSTWAVLGSTETSPFNL